MSDRPPTPLFVTVGSNPARMFGLDAATRARRLAGNAGLECSDTADPARPNILADLAYAWDPSWLKPLLAAPGKVLTYDGRPVLAHVPAGQPLEPVLAAMQSRLPWHGNGLDPLDAATAELSNHELRKRERPFVLPLEPGNPQPAERAAYDAAYKGVTDLLTLYLWRGAAFHLTRWAAQLGLTPNSVTAVGFAFCLLALWLFWLGAYWPGMAAALTFMVLDTVDGKLARCTGTSSKLGNLLDHGVDLIHPPFWWLAWGAGLDDYGTPMEPVLLRLTLVVIIGGYVVQRVIEGIFIRRFGMHIHVWRPIDSRFRLVTARRNPNMVILFAALLFARPDLGLQLVALWVLISLIFHAVRLAQANARRDRGRTIHSWLA